MKEKVIQYQLKDVVEILSGYQARGGLRDNPKGSHTILQGKDIVSDHSAFIYTPRSDTALTRLQPTGKYDHYRVEQGDLLFQARGTENKAYFIDEVAPNTLAAATFYILRNKNKNVLLMPWLAWYLNQEPMQSLFRMEASGTSISYVKRSTLMEVFVSLPALNTQQQIVKVQKSWLQEQ